MSERAKRACGWAGTERSSIHFNPSPASAALMSSDGYKHVYRMGDGTTTTLGDPKRDKFRGQLRHQGKLLNTSPYATREEAARAVDRCVCGG